MTLFTLLIHCRSEILKTNTMPTPKKTTKTEAVATPETKIAELSKDIVKVEKEAKTVVVNTREDYEKASVFLSSVVKPKIKEVENITEFFTKPFVEARRVALENKQKIEAMFSPRLTALSVIEGDVKAAMSSFLREEDRKAKAEEARLAKNREKQDIRREEKGLDPIATPLPTVARTEQTVKSDTGGKTTAKKVWKHEIVDANLMVKDNAFLNNIVRLAIEKGLHLQVLNTMVAAGIREVKGVRIYEDFDISATASKA